MRFLPQYAVARTDNGNWAGFRLSANGVKQVTLSVYSPSDAAQLLMLWLVTNEEHELREIESIVASAKEEL